MNCLKLSKIMISLDEALEFDLQLVLQIFQLTGWLKNEFINSIHFYNDYKTLENVNEDAIDSEVKNFAFLTAFLRCLDLLTLVHLDKV